MRPIAKSIGKIFKSESRFKVAVITTKNRDTGLTNSLKVFQRTRWNTDIDTQISKFIKLYQYLG